LTVVDLALKTLLHDKLRFAITAAGVAFAVLLVFVQVGLFLGLLDNASVTIRHTDADLWVTSRNTPNVDFAHTFPETRVDRVRSIPGVQRADNLIAWFFTTQLPSGAQEGTFVYALKDFSHWNLPWRVAEGRLQDLRRGPYIFLDASAVKRMGPFQVGDYREVNGRRVQIIGRSRDALSFTTTPITFMDYDLAQSIQSQSLQGQTTYILVKLANGADLETVRAEIRRRLPYNDVFTRDEWAARSRNYWVVSTGLGLNMGLTVFLGCLVGVVVVAQTLYTSTMEHLKEFGTVKAIGGSNRDIYGILAKQASVAALVGFVLGALGALVLGPVMASVDLKLIVPPVLGVAVFVGTFALCLGAAMISFRKVAAIDPALVFRT
jgi:putative ABC transport system permease protein